MYGLTNDVNQMPSRFKALHTWLYMTEECGVSGGSFQIARRRDIAKSTSCLSFGLSKDIM
jgi:hypothetical protein